GQRVAAVFELVLHLDGLARQLAELADGDEPGVELVGQRPPEDEAAGLDADHDLDPRLPIVSGQEVDDPTKGRTVLEQGRDVLEEDTLGRKVLDVPDLCAQVGDVVHGAGYLTDATLAAQAEGPLHSS